MDIFKTLNNMNMSEAINTFKMENYGSLLVAHTDIQDAEKSISDESTKQKLANLDSEVKKVIDHPTQASVNGMAEALGVGTYSHRPGFHLDNYLKNIEKQQNENIFKEAKNQAEDIVQSLER